jgi:hypothetical protein
MPLWGPVDPVATSPRELVCEPVDLRTALRLNREWHSTLPDLGFKVASWGGRSVAFAGLDPSGAVSAVAVWSAPVAANRIGHLSDHLLELRRLAIPDYAPKYTATWMLGQMARHIRKTSLTVCRLLSYQQTDVHSGTIYKAANWHPAYSQDRHLSWEDHSNVRQIGHDQSTAPKVRWEYQIRSCDATKTAEQDRPTIEALF